MMVTPGSVTSPKTEFTLNLRKNGSIARTYSMGKSEQPWWIDRDKVKGFDFNLFIRLWLQEKRTKDKSSSETSLWIQP